MSDLDPWREILDAATVAEARRELRADLRAEVEALKYSVDYGLSTVGDWAWNRALEEVLALIDGGTHA